MFYANFINTEDDFGSENLDFEDLQARSLEDAERTVRETIAQSCQAEADSSDEPQTYVYRIALLDEDEEFDVQLSGTVTLNPAR